jgi:hypothetical protein
MKLQAMTLSIADNVMASPPKIIWMKSLQTPLKY